MERNIDFKDFEPPKNIRTLIDRLTSKLERNVSTLSPELVHLRLMVVRNSARSLYTTSITLVLPGKTLAAKEEQRDVRAGIRAAFVEIERQLEKQKANLRREHWKRPERREEAREMKTEAASSVAAESKRDLFFSLVHPHLKRLHHFVRHLIRYAEAMGDLVEGDMTPPDVVDGALVRAYREFLKGRTIPDVKNWMLRHALEQLDAEVTRVKVERAGTVQIDEDVPEIPPTQEAA
jgi:ribosomal subunit interface protein